MLQLIDDALEAFFKLTAVHRASHKRANIQLEQALVHERGRDIAFDDALGEPFDDGGLADAGFADERGVVLGAARQNLNDAFDFHLATNDRVEFLFLGFGGQVGGQLVDERGLGVVASSGASALGCASRCRRGG